MKCKGGRSRGGGVSAVAGGGSGRVRDREVGMDGIRRGEERAKEGECEGRGGAAGVERHRWALPHWEGGEERQGEATGERWVILVGEDLGEEEAAEAAGG